MEENWENLSILGFNTRAKTNKLTWASPRLIVHQERNIYGIMFSYKSFITWRQKKKKNDERHMTYDMALHPSSSSQLTQCQSKRKNQFFSFLTFKVKLKVYFIFWIWKVQSNINCILRYNPRNSLWFLMELSHTKQKFQRLSVAGNWS